MGHIYHSVSLIEKVILMNDLQLRSLAMKIKSATREIVSKTMKNGRKTSIFTVIIPLALLMVACGNRDDLARIQKFTGLANKAGEGFPKIANDFYLSCLRSAQYQAFLPEREKNPVLTITEEEEQCNKDLQDFGPRLIEANKVLVDYTSLLGKLAADDAIDYSADLNSLQAKLSQLPTITESQVEGGVNIATILLRAATDGYRRKQLKEVIESTDNALQTFIQGITTITQDVYIGIYLKNEQSLINGYYGDYMTNLIKNRTKGDTQELTVLLLELNNKWAVSKEEVEQKRNLARDYIGILASIAQNHKALSTMFAAGKSPSSKEMKKMLDKNTKDLESFVQKLQDVQGK